MDTTGPVPNEERGIVYGNYTVDERAESNQGNGHKNEHRPEVRVPVFVAELTRRDQYCGYRKRPDSTRLGHFHKEPFQTYSPQDHASSTNPKTWAPFMATMSRVQKGTFDGALYAVSGRDDDLSGYDLDQSLDDDGKLKRLFAPLVAILKKAGRLEYSPSMRGLRWWGWGKLPDGAQAVVKTYGEFQQVEFYGPGHPHFASVTGLAYEDSPATLGDPAACQAILTEAYEWVFGPVEQESEQAHEEAHQHRGMTPKDWLLFSEIAQSRDNYRFLPLWSGSDLQNGGDASSGDAKLARALAYWLAKDAARMDRWFRASARMRPKWDERHYANGQTYGAHLIETAIGWTVETYRGEGTGSDEDIGAPAFRMMTDLEAQNLKPPRSLIGDVLYEQALGLLVGPWGVWKSFIALSMAMSLVTEKDWLLRPVKAGGGAVVYICSEGEQAMGQRIAAWKLKNGVPLDQQTDFYLVPDVVDLLDVSHVERLIDQIYERGIWPVMIMVDTVAWAMGGAEENSNSEATKLTMAMRRLRQRFGCAVLGVHHSGKDSDKGARGASAFEANVDTIMEVKLDEGCRAEDLAPGVAILLKSRKVKDAPRFGSFWLTTEAVDLPRDDEEDTSEYAGADGYAMPYGSAQLQTSLVVTLSDKDRHHHAPRSPAASPPKGHYTDSERWAWAKLNDLCARTPDGATYTDWRERAMRGGKMAESTFKLAAKRLETDGYVEHSGDGRGSTYRTKEPDHD